MTFEEIIARANQLPHGNFHIWVEYPDGRRGYYTSRKTLADARAFAVMLRDPMIYDRDGNDIDLCGEG